MNLKRLICGLMISTCVTACTYNHSRQGSFVLVDNNVDFTVDINGRTNEISYSDNLDLITSLPPDSSIIINSRTSNGEPFTLSLTSHASKGVQYQLDNHSPKTSEEQAKSLFRKVSLSLYRNTSFATEPRSQYLNQLGGTDSLIAELPHLADDSVSSAYLNFWLARYNFNPEQLSKMIAKSTSVSSDNKQRKLLVDFATKQKLSTDNYLELLEVSKNVESDLEMRKLYTFLFQASPNTEVGNQIIRNAGQFIASDLELRKTLISVIKHNGFLTEQWPTWLAAAKSIDSDLELGKLFLNAPGPQKEKHLIQLIKLAETELQSDYELAKTLIHIAENSSLKEQSRAAVLQATKTISSDRERRKVEQALN